MGKRAVEITFTFGIKDNRKVTDRFWDDLEEHVATFIEDAYSDTIVSTPVIVDARYFREVELRERGTYE